MAVGGYCRQPPTANRHVRGGWRPGAAGGCRRHGHAFLPPTANCAAPRLAARCGVRAAKGCRRYDCSLRDAVGVMMWLRRQSPIIGDCHERRPPDASVRPVTCGCQSACTSRPWEATRACLPLACAVIVPLLGCRGSVVQAVMHPLHAVRAVRACHQAATACIASGLLCRAGCHVCQHLSAWGIAMCCAASLHRAMLCCVGGAAASELAQGTCCALRAME